MKAKSQFCIKLPFLLLIILTTGCSINEDNMDDCGGRPLPGKTEMRLIVRFDPDMFELPSEEHIIESIGVYAFDENGTFVDIWQTGSFHYSGEAVYYVPVNLEHGTYTFIAWTNAGEHYKTNPTINGLKKGQTSMEDFVFYLDGPADKRFNTDIPDLHYGRIEGAVNDPTRDTEYTIYLIPDTYRINLTVEGLEDYGDNFSMEISDNNGHYNFKNRVLEKYGIYSHERIGLSTEEGTWKASIRCLSLTDDHAIENIGRPRNADRSPLLKVFDRTANTELFSDDMVKIIRKAYAESGQTVDFDRTYRFDIVLSFDANMDVTISVNGWSYRYNPIEL